MKKAAPKKVPPVKRKAKAEADPYALFRHNIKQLRAKEQLTIVELSAIFKIPTRRLQRLETGTLQPTLPDLLMFAKRHGLTAETLLNKKARLSIAFE